MQWGYLGEGHKGNDVLVVKSHMRRAINPDTHGNIGTFSKVPASLFTLLSRIWDCILIFLCAVWLGLCDCLQFVHLVRHPMNALAAERKRRVTGSHTDTPPFDVFVNGT